MKKILALLCALALLCLPAAAVPAAGAPAVSARAALLISLDTGQVFLEKESEAEVPVAFTAKLMTALLAWESLGKSARVSVKSGFRDDVENLSSMQFVEGESFTVEELCCLVLIQGADEAANILAEGVCDRPAFVERMNARAAELGMEHTRFQNPHGLYDPEAHTTARDAARLLFAFSQVPELLELSDATFTTLPATEKSEARVLYSSNLLLNAGSEFCSSRADGGKNFSDSRSGSCLGTTFVTSGRRLCYAAFGEADDETLYRSAKAAIDWVVASYSIVTVCRAGDPCDSTALTLCRRTDQMIAVSGETVSRFLPDDADLSLIRVETDLPDSLAAPIEEGERLGTGRVYYGSELLYEIPVLAGASASRDLGLAVGDGLSAILGHPATAIFFALFFLMLAILILRALRIHRRRKK